MNNMYDILAKLASVEKQNLTESAEQVAEKIEPPIKTDPAERGKYKGKDISDLKAMKKANLEKTEKYRERGEKVPDELKGKTAELNFAIRAKQAHGGKWGKIKEEEMEEGNEFTQARMDAIRSGRPTFKVDGKTYKVTGDTSDEKAQMDESVIEEGFAEFFDKKQMYKKIGADVEGRADDYTVTFKDGSRKRYQEVDGRRRVTTLEPIDRNDAVDDDGEVVKRGRGRPKGTGRKMGARGKTKVDEQELEEDYDKDEYDEEGEMAQSQARTIEDAAKELQDILDADENLPEWVQSKITKAADYIDTARDYLKANRPEGEEEVDVEVTGDEEEMIPERELTPAEMKKREEIVKSMKKDKAGFEKRYGKRGEEVMYATATKQAKEKAEEGEDKEEEQVEETTVSGSVATAPATGKAKGMFGKGVYESAFDDKLKTVLNEGMNISMSMGENGEKSLTVNATNEDAVKLATILKLAGMESAAGYEEACPTCGATPCGCDEQVDEDYANSPDEVTTDTDYMTMQLSGGLNGPKTTGQTTVPVINRDAERQGVMGKRDADILEATERKLAALYKQYEGK